MPECLPGDPKDGPPATCFQSIQPSIGKQSSSIPCLERVTDRVHRARRNTGIVDLGPHLDDLPPSLRLPQESGVQTTVSGWNWLQANQYAW